MIKILFVIPDEATGQMQGAVANWTIGTEMPGIPAEAAQLVIADGLELKYIIDNFANLPYRKDAVKHSWHGDFAKLIVGNLVQSSVLIAK